MTELQLPGGYERFIERSDVKHARNAIQTSTTALNYELSYASVDYDGVVAFSHETDDQITVPLAHHDSYSATMDRSAFRAASIVGRRVLLKGTALGEALKEKAGPTFAQSKINPRFQMTYIHPLLHDTEQVGALQYSFTAPEGTKYITDLPDDKYMETLHSKLGGEVRRIAAETARLQRLVNELGTIGSLATGLELERPIAPNAFIIRWDVQGSSKLVTSDAEPAYSAFIAQAHARLRTLAEEYVAHLDEEMQTDGHEAYDNQGDGAYIILPLPRRYYQPYSKQYLADFKKYNVDRFTDILQGNLDTIASQYHKTFNPKVVLTGDFGYVEANSIGKLTSSTMYQLAHLQKEK
jgi:hypothetical protein